MKEEVRQYLVLTRYFFDRLFQKDIVDFADQIKERIIGVLTILAVWFYQWVFYYKRITLKYEEEPEPVLAGLDCQTPLHKWRAHES